MKSLFWTCAAVFVTVTPAFAAAPPNVLMAGTLVGFINQLKSGVSCSASASGAAGAGAGGSTFKRNASGPAEITFAMQYTTPPTVMNPPGEVYGQGGLAVLTFKTATSGSVAFAYPWGGPPPIPPALKTVTFSDYSQTWNATTAVLDVSFSLTVAGCSIAPVQAVYRN